MSFKLANALTEVLRGARGTQLSPQTLQRIVPGFTGGAEAAQQLSRSMHDTQQMTNRLMIGKPSRVFHKIPQATELQNFTQGVKNNVSGAVPVKPISSDISRSIRTEQKLHDLHERLNTPQPGSVSFNLFDKIKHIANHLNSIAL
jgi:hypothetical protein